MNLLCLNENTHPIYWINNFLSDEDIKKIIKYSEKIESKVSKIGNKIINKEKKPFTLDYHIKKTNIGNVPRTRVGKVKRIILNDDTNWLYKKIIKQIHTVNQENFNFILKFVEDLQLMIYDENDRGFYAKHYDCGVIDRIENFVDVRKLSFSIQMSEPDDYEGGELILYLDGKEIVAPKSKGTIIFFQSNILHEVKPVNKGTRHSLVSWIQGPNLR